LETDRGWRDPQLFGLFVKLHREVLSRIADYATASAGDHHLESMRQSLAHLQTYLLRAEQPGELAPPA
ncbi:MAG: hypothetical protein WCC22_12540, partial [Terriglobales bacterium]